MSPIGNRASADLTLLITLKDRFEFTKRICEYFSKARYPFHIIFADGSLENDTEEFFENLKNPGFSYEYIRYPKDKTYSDFYKKCASAIKKVKTPYVMLADNDDFPIADGQLKALDFLKNNPQYVGCMGRVPGLYLRTPQNPNAPYLFFSSYYCNVLYNQRPLNQSSGLLRIKEYLKHSPCIYYGIFQTGSMVTTFNKIENKDLRVLYLYEIFFSCLQLAQGPVHFLDAITYIRQKGSSQMASTYYKGLFFDFFYSEMLTETKQIFLNISKLIDKKVYEEIFDQIYESFYLKIKADYVRIGFYLWKKIFSLLTKRKIYFLFINKVFKIFPSVAFQLSMWPLRSLTNKKNLLIIKKIVTMKK
jgi:glycosyltransferase domain-containing protein